MSRTTKIPSLNTLLTPLAVAIAVLASLPANAARFDIGEIEGQFDSQLSVGASFGTSSIDKDLIWVNNGGTNNAANSDDGRLNFEKGDMFSQIFKGTHDLSFKYGNTGVFLRGKYWYDFELKDGSRELYDIDDSGRRTAAKTSGAQLLDAFIYHNYNIGNLPGSVRVGRQVVSWGESTFIQNSINSINPIDVAAFRRPGAEIKEGLIPVNMVFVSQSLTDNLGMEAFYQLEWDPTVLDNCGTFFSFTDSVAKGCNQVGVGGSQLNSPADPTNPFAYVPRSGNREASDSGQYGVAFRLFVDALNQTEFGFFAMNYHSRTPIFSTTAGTGAPTGFSFNDNTGVFEVPLDANYFIEYPEDIRLYGMSFQTNIAGVAVSGEVSYRPNQPLQISTNDLVGAALGAAGNPVSPVNATGIGGTVFGVPAAPGTDLKGYKRMPVTQAQMTVINFFDNVMGAERLTLIGEVGYNHISGIKDSPTELRFGRDSMYGSGPLAVPGLCETVVNAAQPKYCTNDGFYTQHSWGLRTVASLEYRGFAGVALTPNAAFAWDVEGYGPNFNEGSKAASLGLNAVYNNKYNASINYTNFFDGDFNTNVDRDFVAVSVGVNF
ncbi:DUF1302 domain-containing protein [Halopseudomonas pelagia]|uniref:DUF1302 domain-containing protein n=1 Tax=Halopseudomonas pelagia TaxID=553151 RepID=UPI0003AA5F87|nr:DUF1302 domain-containing protein [Halopseudomonas pelagia]|tara:strand:+ start:2273 stop:4084 length:1812 start_codon:yes stop_codon:yes gene_type:complete